MKAEREPSKNSSASIGFLRFHGLGLSKILPRLYLSGEDAVKSRSTLKSYGISHILNLTTNVENYFEPEIVYKRVKVNDLFNQDMSECFQESIEFIENALGQNESNCVLVHCNAGVSRSASVVMAYLMKIGWCESFDETYEYVRSCRPAVAPNPGFILQLKEFETRLAKTPDCKNC